MWLWRDREEEVIEANKRSRGGGGNIRFWGLIPGKKAREKGRKEGWSEKVRQKSWVCRLLCQHRSLFIVRFFWPVLTLMPTADPISLLHYPLHLPYLSSLSLSLCACRGRQLKLWILCVISFYWCNNQIFMMTIPADNDDDKSAFSISNILSQYTSTIYRFIYVFMVLLNIFSEWE